MRTYFFVFCMAAYSSACSDTTGRSPVVGQDAASDSGEDVSLDVPVDHGDDVPSGDLGPVGACLEGASPQLQCNPITLETCGATRTCVLSGDTSGGFSSRCGSPGAVPRGRACTLASQCARGLTCYSGQCVKFCCPGDDRTCTDTDAGGNPGMICGLNLTRYNLGQCVPSGCDPTAVTNNGCQDDAPYCAFVVSRGTTQCFGYNLASPRMEGEGCGRNNDCSAGYGCVGRTGTMVCRRLCRVEDPSNPCPSLHSCVQNTVEAGNPATGYCQPI